MRKSVFTPNKSATILPLTPAENETDKKAQGQIGFGAVGSCVLYSFASVSMVLANKSLASSYDTSFNILLVVFQSVVAILCCEVSKMLGWISYPPFNMSSAKSWVPVNVFFCGMLFTGMGSLQHNSVPMVTVFKNIANIFTAVGDMIFFKSPIEPLVRLSFGIMLLGAMAASSDSSVSSIGLMWMLSNCVCTSGYCLYMKFATKTIKMSKFGMVYCNNVLATVLLLPVVVLNGEVAEFMSRPDLHTLTYLQHNFFAGFVGFFLNFASLNCVAATSPTTYAIVGSLNKIPTAFLGVILFHTTLTKETWLFCSVGVAGGFLYSFAKTREKLRKDKLSAKLANSSVDGREGGDKVDEDGQEGGLFREKKAQEP